MMGVAPHGEGVLPLVKGRGVHHEDTARLRVLTRQAPLGRTFQGRLWSLVSVKGNLCVRDDLSRCVGFFMLGFLGIRRTLKASV